MFVNHLLVNGVKQLYSNEAKQTLKSALGHAKSAKTPAEYFAKANPKFLKAIALAPDHPEPRYNFALYLWSSYAFRDAAEEFRVYLTLAPFAKDRSNVEKWLKTLGGSQ